MVYVELKGRLRGSAGDINAVSHAHGVTVVLLGLLKCGHTIGVLPGPSSEIHDLQRNGIDLPSLSLTELCSIVYVDCTHILLAIHKN